MGSTRSRTLQPAFRNGNFKHLLAHSDPHLGSFSILRFGKETGGEGIDGERLMSIEFDKFCAEIALLQVLDPSEFDSFTSDTDEFTKLISLKHPAISEFLFVEPKVPEDGTYHLLFEFSPIQPTTPTKEREVWEFLLPLLTALIFLEDRGLHYPYLRKRYVFPSSSTSGVKLLNPHCFPSFLRDLFKIYLNVITSQNEKKQYQTQQIQRNVKEFAIMILAFVEGEEENTILKNPGRIREIIAGLGPIRGFSNHLTNLLIYAFENRNTMKFSDLKKFIELPSLEKFLKNGPGPNGPVDYNGSVKFLVANHGSSDFSAYEPLIPSDGSSKSTINPSVSQPSPKLKRSFMKWCEDTGTHQEFGEFDDGRVEKLKKFVEVASSKSLAESHGTGPQVTETTKTVKNGDGMKGPLKKSVMASYNIKEVKGAARSGKGTWNIILFGLNNEPAKIILTAVVKGEYKGYEFMREIIDQSKNNRPSVYHHIDDVPNPSVNQQKS